MKEFWNKLTRTQQYYLMGGAAFVVIFLVFQLLIFPLWDTRQKTLNSIRVNEKVLKEMSVLGAEYSVLKERAAAVQQVLASRPQDFTLFSYLEKKAGEIQLKPNIKYINTLKGSVTEVYEESSVEMKLDSMTMKQLTDFLYLAESPKDFVMISKISINKMKESPEYLTATIQVTTFQPSKTGSR
jgi:general secretion pathway protein M